MGEHVYPRRRDVRERLYELYAVLYRYYNEGEFDRDFLNDVRDMMRAGCDVETAVLAAVPEPMSEDVELDAFLDALDEKRDEAYYHWLGEHNDAFHNGG